jgi:hypothetical protein
MADRMVISALPWLAALSQALEQHVLGLQGRQQGLIRWTSQPFYISLRGKPGQGQKRLIRWKSQPQNMLAHSKPSLPSLGDIISGYGQTICSCN